MKTFGFILIFLISFVVFYMVEDFFKNYEFYRKNKMDRKIRLGKILTALMVVGINAGLIVNLIGLIKNIMDKGFSNLGVKGIILYLVFISFVLLVDYLIFRSMVEIKKIDAGETSLLSAKNNKKNRKK
ncbi:MAG: hypothetical protein SPI59_04545 [Finegoldia sp.]|nr:hypothetical protein [Finegoldia sp.]